MPRLQNCTALEESSKVTDPPAERLETTKVREMAGPYPGGETMSEPQKVPGQTPDGEWCYYHDWEEFIDPHRGGFIRCRLCGKEIDCEDPDGDIG